MSGSQLVLLGGPFGAGPAGDPNWQNVSLLSGTTSTNAGQNNTFLDSSTNNFTITRNGNTTQGTFTPFSQAAGYWSNYFDGTGDYLDTSNNTIFAPGTGDFTIEGWFYCTSSSNTTSMKLLGTTTGYQTGGFAILRSGFSANGDLDFVIEPSDQAANKVPIGTFGSNIALNSWNHFAVARSGSNISAWLNGTRSTNKTNSANINDSGGNTLRIGGNRENTSNLWQGYISNIKYNKGTAYYDPTQTTITVPTLPVTNTSGTDLLTCQSNRFIDNSDNAFVITPAGDVAVTPFQPFGAPITAYSSSTVGGSGYFDGTGDYLSVASNTAFNVGTGNFTVECWLYPLDLSGAPFIFDTRSAGGDAGYCLYFSNGGELFCYTSGADRFSGGTSAVKANQWSHIALVRSGSTLTCYVNGVSGASGTYSGSMECPGPLVIAEAYNTSSYLKCYMASFRLVKGTAVYTSNFTPPTAPLPAISGTSLLLSYTNANIYDQAAKNNAETVGNAQVSTSVYKYGTSSAYFDGTGDYLQFPYSQNKNFGAGDFTIEAWVYFNSVASGQMVVCGYSSSKDFAIYTSASGTLSYYLSSNGTTWDIASGVLIGTIATSQWYHVALARTSGVISPYLNGVRGTTTASTASIYNTSEPLYVGSSGASAYLNGYVSDLRLTKGYCRYPYSFTPPTTALPNFYQAATTPVADPYFDYTTLLLPGTGTNGAQNNTFLDSSTNAFSITRNGNTTQGTFSPFSQADGYWGNYFDGTGDYLTVPNNAAFDVGSGNWTIECWVYLNTLTSSSGIIGKRADTGADAHWIILYVNTSGAVAANVANAAGDGWAASGSSTTTVSANSWNHIALVRNGSDLSIYVNGIKNTVSSGLSGAIYNPTASPVYIGKTGDTGGATFPFKGYISNLRLVKGTAVYTATFTTPTAPLTAITNTSLLTCQSNRFVDNSSNAFAITVYGDTSIQQFCPFNPTAAWSAATNGGSGYFDGTGDYLSLSSNAAFDFTTDDFTFECWFYWTSANSGANDVQVLIGDGSDAGGLILSLEPSTKKFYCYFNSIGGRFNSGSPVIALNTWNHVAWVRSSGTHTIYLNGVSGGTFSSSASVSSTGGVGIGKSLAGTSTFSVWQGYISNVRIVKGTAVYSSNFTPPTTPLTAITNTKLLANFTNAGIYDATAKNDLETVGNAQISTTQYKWGSSSMYFDGTGDYLTSNTGTTDLYAFGSGDFTIEFWVRFNSVAIAAQIIYDGRPSSSPGAQPSIYMDYATIKYFTNSDDRIIGSSLSASTWYHVAVARYGTSTKMFVNGNQVGATYSDSTVYTNSSGRPFIGTISAGSPDYYLSGYLQDLRITKGIARYTQNFTPPAAAFQLY